MFKNATKEFIAFLFRYSGIPYFLKRTISKKMTTIIIYHNPKCEIFEKHIAYLKKNFNIINLGILIKAIYTQDWSQIPPYSLIITIDDGFKENYQLMSTIKKFEIQPTMYICSHIVDTNRKFWFETELDDMVRIVRYENARRLAILKQKLEFRPDKEYELRSALSLDELIEMSLTVDFQSHSKFHPILPNCSDSESQFEIVESKEFLEKILKKPITHFSYPNGDYGNREINFLKKCGYQSARTVDLGWNDLMTDPFKLKAMGIQDDASINVLISQITGFFGYIRFLLKGSYNGKHPKFV